MRVLTGVVNSMDGEHFLYHGDKENVIGKIGALSFL